MVALLRLGPSDAGAVSTLRSLETLERCTSEMYCCNDQSRLDSLLIVNCFIPEGP